MTVVNHMGGYMKVVVEGRPRCCSKSGDVTVGGYDGLINTRYQCQESRVRSWTPVRACCQGNRARVEPSRESSPLGDPCSSLLPRESSWNRAAKGIESARGPLFEPDAKRIEPPRQWTRGYPGLEGLEPARLVHNTNRQPLNIVDSRNLLLRNDHDVATHTSINNE